MPRPHRKPSRWAPFWRIWHEETTKRGVVLFVSALLAWALKRWGLAEVPLEHLPSIAEAVVNVLNTVLDILIGGQVLAGFMGASRRDQ